MSRAAPLCPPIHKSRVIRNSSTRPSQRSNRKSLRADWGPRLRGQAGPKVKPWAWQQAQRWMPTHSLCKFQTSLIRRESGSWEARARVIWCTLRGAPQRRKRNRLVVIATENSQEVKFMPRRRRVRDHSSTSKPKALSGTWLMSRTAKPTLRDTCKSRRLWTQARMSSTSWEMSSHSSRDRKDPHAAVLVWSSCSQLCNQVWRIATKT